MLRCAAMQFRIAYYRASSFTQITPNTKQFNNTTFVNEEAEAPLLRRQVEGILDYGQGNSMSVFKTRIRLHNRFPVSHDG